jgi:hypothetical protein
MATKEEERLRILVATLETEVKTKGKINILKRGQDQKATPLRQRSRPKFLETRSRSR